MADKVTAYLSLGSNIDDRMDYLTRAQKLLNENLRIKIIKTSGVYETEPWPRDMVHDEHPHGEEGRKWFLNQVVEIETSLLPQELLRAGQEIEKKIGRKKREHWGDREVDVDVLLYSDQIIDTPDLQLPHRHMQDRQFVLVPLVEIAPDLKDPVAGHRFSDILKKVRETDDHKVTPFL